MMDFVEFCEFWKLSEELQCKLQPHWDGLNARRDGKLPYFMDMAYLEKLYPYLKAPRTWEEFRPEAEAVIQVAAGEPELAFWAWAIFHCSFEMTPGLFWGAPPEPFPLLGEKSGILALMISLGALPLMAQRCRILGIPERYAYDALAWMGGTMLAYAAAHQGRIGRPFEFGWIRCHIDGKLFRIGRLEYLLHNYIDWMPPVYRNQAGEVIALCGDNWRLDEKFRQVNPPQPAHCITHLAETSRAVTGTPILPDGTVDFERTVTLDRRDWQPLASPWTLCPSLHIPAGSRMPFEEVKASMIEARKFFADYFHRDVPFFCCCSWILNPPWQTLLPDSNMARFRREGYAVPAPDWGDDGGTVFLFGRSDLKPEEMPATNRAQKAMQEASKRGENGIGTVFFAADDFEKLGREYYRRENVAGKLLKIQSCC